MSQPAGTQRRPMSLEDMLGAWHRLGGIDLSPDGSRILYEYQTALWVVDRERHVERLTEGRAPHWSPVSDEFAFLRGDPPQVWTRDADGGEHQRTTLPRGVSDYAWFSDGCRLAVICPGEETGLAGSERPRPESIVEIHRPNSAPGDTLWIAPVGPGDARLIAAAPQGVRWSGPAVHPSGEWVAVTENGYRGEAEHVAVIDCATGTLRRPVPSAIRPCEDPQWSPDGRRLAFHYSPHDYIYPLQCQCAVVPLEAGEPAGEVACYGEGYFVAEWQDLCWHPDGQTIYAIGIRGSTRPILRIDLRTGDVRPLTDALGWYGNLRLSRDGEWLACSFISPTCLGELCLFSTSSGERQTLLDVNAPLGAIQLADVQLVHWRTEDGWELEGVLVKPLDYRPGRRYPMLVDFHGGPAPGGTARFYPHWHWWAARGYLVFSPDFRGGQTYAWAEPETYEQDYLDSMAGVDFLIEAGCADTERLGIYGFSYGADLVAWALGHTGRFRAAVLVCGGGDPLVGYGLGHGPGGNAVLASAMGGRPWEEPERYRYYSPLTYLHQASTPTILFTGDADLVSIQMLYAWLRQAGVEAEAIHYRGERHGFSRPEHRRDWLERTLAWFDRHLGGQ